MFSLFVLSFFNSQAQSYILSQSPDSIINLIPYATSYVDKTNNLTFDDLQLQWQQEDFAPASELRFNEKFQDGKYTYWLHWSVENVSEDSISFMYRGNSVDSITLYIQNTSGRVELLHAGRWTNGTEGEIQFPFSSRLAIPLSIAPKSELKIWIKLWNEYAFNDRFYARLYPSELEIRSYSNAYMRHKGFLIGFYSILLFLFVFNLVLYVQNKDKSFLYYALYVLFVFLYFLRESSYFDHFTHFTPIVFYQYRYYSIFGLSMLIFYFLFIDHFIDAKNKHPTFHRYIMLMVAFTVVHLIVLQIVKTIDVNLGYQVMHYGRYISLPFHLLGIIWMLTKKDRMVRYVLIGTGLLFAGGTMTFLEGYIGWTTDKWWDADQIFAFSGVLAEVCFFTIVLGRKQFLVQQEKLKAENDLIYSEKEAQQLKELDQIKTSFFTNITHEFRTPLTVIKGLTDDLKGRQRYQQDEKKLQTIHQNSDRILDLVNQLLELSKLESGKQRIQYVQADIILFLKYLTDSFQSLAHHKKIMLGFYSNSEELFMDFDQEKIQRILSNLLSNALKFTDQYGQIKVSAESIDNQLIVKVNDTGKGIPSENIPHIFDHFYQVKKDDYEGTGIGLALVRELVQLLNGTIKVTSEIDQGTTFTITLPIQRQAIRQEIKRPSAVAITSKDAFVSSPLIDKEKAKILLIEDNQDILNYLISILANDYDVETAKNGQLGIEKVQTWSPQLVLCDIMMPKMNGYEVCETLKSDAAMAHIPIILLTAKATQTDRLEGLARQADAYLKKPFDKAELLLTIQNLLQRQAILQSPFDTIETDFINQFKAVVQSHLSDENLTLIHLCKYLNIGKTKLTQQVKLATGKTPAQYVRQLRLQHAYYLLKTTDSSVKEVAYDCGFSSVSAFSQGFKEEFGQNASEVKLDR
jgi:signal transduction histidine kinase/DNA-binding response OmpR family regulator